jgi:hypothetical protein
MDNLENLFSHRLTEFWNLQNCCNRRFSFRDKIVSACFTFNRICLFLLLFDLPKVSLLPVIEGICSSELQRLNSPYVARKRKSKSALIDLLQEFRLVVFVKIFSIVIFIIQSIYFFSKFRIRKFDVVFRILSGLSVLHLSEFLRNRCTFYLCFFNELVEFLHLWAYGSLRENFNHQHLIPFDFKGIQWLHLPI